jgi:hypothetical protein
MYTSRKNMKRTVSLLLICLIPACFIAACKDPYPSAPTTVTGRIVDESGKPLEGVVLGLTGLDKIGVASGVPTFSVVSETNADGEYTLSYVVPRATDFVEFSTSSNAVDGVFYRAFIDYGDRYDLYRGVSIPRKDYGKTTIVNFQFRKR